jgi:hypothetical protein
MDIGRRELLAAVASLGLAKLTGSPDSDHADDAVTYGRLWHPLTQSLLDRAGRPRQRLDVPRVEHIIRELASEHGRPVIKWMASPERAFEHLRRYPLDEMVQMPTAHFWPAPSLGPVQDYAELERSLDLYVLANRILRVEAQCDALLSQRLGFRSSLIGATAGPAAVFDARVLAAEIGWIETSLPAVAARAVRGVEDLLSSGRAEYDPAIHHQLLVFEAFDYGLLATWETPDALICVPRYS